MRAKNSLLVWILMAGLGFVVVGSLSVARAQMPRVNRKRVLDRLEALALIGRTPDGGVSRVAFSEADIAGREHILKLTKEAGLAVRLD
ncbi:MAG: Zn-dependent hydrolase, partial [Candidatus Aminicenantes bacterium]|nr:Zn-dependent hydrolase [Candidatus Aminicenantes bacterium]